VNTSLALIASGIAALVPRGVGRFDSMKEEATRVESLSGFLERYVGNCKDPFEQVACQQNVRQTRQTYRNKTLFVNVGERIGEMIKAESDGSGGFRLLVTPFIDGGGYALTHGKPRRQDAQGRPLIDYVVVKGDLPEGMGEMEFRSTFRAGNVSMELLFRPEGVWKMRRRTEAGFYEGVTARFVGMRLVNQRTGAEIATKVF
jgi:hypothetical protein